MKKILNFCFYFILLITFSGCNSQNNEIDRDINYSYGDLVKVKVNNNVIINGNIIENSDDFIILLKSESSDNLIVPWKNVENEIDTLKKNWTNAKDVRLMSIDVLLNNLTLKGNDIGNGYSGYIDEFDNFLYPTNSVETYWVADSANAKGNCYEGTSCAWVVFKPYVQKVSIENKAGLRPIIEISKDYIVK